MKCPPPAKFRSADGTQWAEFCKTPPFVLSARETNLRASKKGARADGLRYEQKALDKLEECYTGQFIRSPWVHFLCRGKELYCQPDAIIDLGNATWIVEIKLSHTSNAWWQLRHLYSPVLRAVPGFGHSTGKVFRLLELCKFFEPSVAFPERFEFCEFDQLQTPPNVPGDLFVSVWKGR